MKLWPGLALTLAVAAAAIALGWKFPLVGGPIFGIVLGFAARSIRRPTPTLLPGIRFASRSVLQGSIVMLGLTLDLRRVASVAITTLPLMLVTIGLCLLAARVLGPLLGVKDNVRTLVGVGTAICGASAIAAVSSVIEVSEAEIAFAISTIFLFNVAAVFIFPALGHATAMSQHQFGVWAGTAINDTSSVVAAAYSFGRAAGDDALITKLARATLILPLVGYFAVTKARAEASLSGRVPWRRIIPWFIVWFAVASAVTTTGLLPTAWHTSIVTVAVALITVALTAIGLQTDFGSVRATGTAPLLLGALLWGIVASSSLVLQALLHIQ